MFFSLDNLWLWVSAALAAAILFAHIFGALTAGRWASVVSASAFPLHLALILSMLMGGAELILVVSCLSVSLLVYVAARAAKLEIEKRREREYDL